MSCQRSPESTHHGRYNVFICLHCHNRLGSLNDRSLFSHSSGGWKSKVKVSGLVFLVASPLALQTATFSLCPWVVFSLCTCVSGVFSSSYKDTSPIGFGPTLMTSFNLNYLLKGCIFKYSHNEVYSFNI